jgi:hypothetical protein
LGEGGRKHITLLEGEITGSHGDEYGMSRLVVWWTFTDVSEVLTASIIALTMEAVRTSETLIKTGLIILQDEGKSVNLEG